jgi:hypothetical protein
LSCNKDYCSNSEHYDNAISSNLICIIEFPSLPTRKCRIMASIGGLMLSYANYFIAIIIFINYDLFIAGGFLLLGFIIFGIISSKLRTISIPLSNFEYSYSDKEIFTWYISKYVC